MTDAWANVRLGDVLHPVGRWEKRDESAEYQFAGTYSYARGIFVASRKHGSSFNLSELQRVRVGDFVYCKIMAWEGAFGVVPAEADNCVMSGAFVAYQSDEQRLDTSFLGWMFKLRSIWEQVGQNSTGTNVRRRSLHPSDFENASVSLPPLAEQRRIVARIKELAAKIAEAQELHEHSMHEAAFLGPAGMKTMRERLLASCERTQTLGEITRVTSGGTPSRENPLFWNGDVPWIKTGELLDGDLSTAEEHITASGVEESSAKVFPPDTVLIALYGQGQTRGRTGRLLISAATNQACAAILPQPEVFESRFLQYWLRSLYYEMREDSHGGAQPNWSGAMVKAIKIALPPLLEQRQIVAHLDALQAKVDGLRTLQQQTAAELDALLPAILDRAFKGQLVAPELPPAKQPARGKTAAVIV